MFSGSIMSPIGQISQFDDAIEDIENYIARVDLFFIANSVVKEKKAASFLTLVGPKIYKLVQTLFSPKEPGECSYEEITSKLKVHFRPKVVIVYERYVFNTRVQLPNENISDFLTGLKSLARTCDFGTMVNDLIRDRFVGLTDTETQRTLLAEPDLTLDKAVTTATAREMAANDVREMGGRKLDIHSVNNVKANSSYKFQSHSKRTKFKSHVHDRVPNPCLGCGGKHWRKDCPYREAECFRCHNKGHIKSHCRNGSGKFKKSDKKQSQTSHITDATDDTVEYLESYNSFIFHNSEKFSKSQEPYVINTTVEGVPVVMELDTGSGRTVMCKDNFIKLWPSVISRPVLRPTNAVLKVYGGEKLKTCGEFRANVTASISSRESVNTDIVVVEGEGPCLFGRDLLKLLNITPFSVFHMSNDSISKNFPELFSPGLGCYNDASFKLIVDPNIPAKYCKSRPIPYALRSKVDKELDRLVSEDIISPVTHSDWAAAIVPVLKPDGSVRICGDYKLTVNKAVKLDTYPIPKLEDLFSALSGGKIFTKLDMSQAYNQLCLDESSKMYTVINTHRGLFKYNRLCFGISSAPGIFQRAMEQLLRDLPGVVCYLDDILISGSTPEEHEQRVNTVLQILQDKGLKLKLTKCSFGVKEVRYLGYVINEKGINTDSDKVKAISDAPRPTDIKQLQAYLGSLNFYRRFLHNAALILEPLNKLLRKDISWHWSDEQEKAFVASKNLLINSSALVHFSPDLPLVVISDSSSYGVGAVLCHKVEGRERPLCFASRALTVTERKYSQLEKEGLALIFALKKFHDYLWGRNFTLVTDHKPLLGLFSPDKAIPPMASGRIQRWALLLQAYKFTLVHRSGATLGTADALSRLPLPMVNDSVPVLGEWINLINFLESSPVTALNISQKTRTDPIISKVLKYCEIGWPNTISDPDLSPYFSRRNELSIENGCVLWGYRVIIPNNLRQNLLGELHAGHVGASRMKELARSYLWWPGLDSELEGLVKSCPECMAHRKMPAKAELHPWEWPENPWHRIHVDYAGPIKKKYFLVLVDAQSKWVELFPTNGPTTSETIKHLRNCFARFGLPVSLVSDNGTCFTSAEFQEFLNNNGIRHITTAVYKPSTNGLAERMVQTFKQALTNSTEPLDVFLDKFLFKYRITPHATTGVSPAELMLKRKCRNRLDLLFPSDNISFRVSKKQEIQKASYSKARTINLNSGDSVAVRNYATGNKWLPAVINKKTGPLSYRCDLPDGRIFKRHQDQLILIKEASNPVSENVQISDGSQSKKVSTPSADSTNTNFPISNNTSLPDDNEAEFSKVSPTTATVPLPSNSPKLRRSAKEKRPVVHLNL